MRRRRRLHSCALFVSAVFILAIGAAAQASPAPSEVLNRSYLSSCGRDKPANLLLKNGKFGRYLLMADGGTEAELMVLGSSQIKPVRDGREHFAVFARCVVMGRHGYELFVLRRSGKRLIQIANAVSSGVSGLYGLKEIRQSNDLIQVSLDHLQSSRSTVVERYEFDFRLNGTKLALVGQRRAGK